jgi:ATP-dependent Clp protease ATP-binding subunit ClpC
MSPYPESFTPDAARAVSLAAQAARSLGHNYVGAEHLFAGIVKLGAGTTADALKHIGLTLPMLKQEIEAASGVVKGKKSDRAIPYTPRCKEIIKRANSRARDRGGQVEVEDLFFELLTETEGLPARIFRKRAVDVAKIKSIIGSDADSA